MSKDTELLTEIRDLLALVAEPQIAKQQDKQRSALKAAVGTGAKKRRAVLLMDGSRSQAAIVKEATIDGADVSRLVKSLSEAKLLVPDSNKMPKLAIRIPANFFEGDR